MLVAALEEEWENQTSVTEFILLGFGDVQELQVLLFLVFLLVYIITMAGNILIIALITVNHQLHTPMYFFLGNLSCLETCYSSNILPKILATFITGGGTISVWGCITQLYVFAALVVTECCLLAVMSYDRYLAICKPLHYSMIMKEKLCFTLVLGSWVNGFLSMFVILYLLSRLTFCGPNEIDHVFCDFTPILRITCSETHVIEWVSLILSSLSTLPPFMFTMNSYIFIISTILKIPSTTGRKKAFSTCSSHLIVVTIFYGTLIIVYVLPKNKLLRTLYKVLSLLYTAFTPLVNPMIYSLRNKEVKEALKKSVQKIDLFHKTPESSSKRF
ncbi:olfactory receptor 6B1-like [Elgaria multicarinata webbii]|uniref:olfactory receptor 6B1-like n=1 Tax=Elgaria multicarinata webbii TaxID=159646 RepID=UPI002FCCEDFE